MLRQSGAGANLHTIQTAGITRLEDDSEVREAIDRMAASGKDPLGAYRNSGALNGLDMLKVFRVALKGAIPVEYAIDSEFRRIHEANKPGAGPAAD